MVSSWSDPASRGTHLSKIAVVALRKSELNRRLFEDEMCVMLRKHSVNAIQSYTFMPEQRFTNADTLLDQFRGRGFEGLLFSEVIGLRSDVQTIPRSRHYVPEARYDRFGNYYATVMRVEIIPEVETIYEYVQIQTHLYRANDGLLIWGAQSETERIGDLQMRIEDYATAIARDLAKNGFIHK